MRLNAISFEPRNGSALADQTKDCIVQIARYFDSKSFRGTGIVSLNFFIAAENNEDYYLQKGEVISLLPDDILDSIPIVYLAQPPASGTKISIEVHFIPRLEQVELVSKTESGVRYLLASNDNGGKTVFATGICPGHSFSDTEKDSEWVFQAMERILHNEGMDFSNIYRQWNYIEGIVDLDLQECLKCQHYQLFNDVRSKYYAKADFQFGYPAATGIGTMAGGAIVSFYASSSEETIIRSIENPHQKAAFEYSDKVLVGDAAITHKVRSTPKFSRAKLVEGSTFRQVYISGTASIKEEKTVAENDVVTQTEVTIENIKKLIQPETISLVDDSAKPAPKIEFYRVYIKNPEDYEAVKQVCESHFPDAENIYVVSDICRGKLLVEIEALATSILF